jgi:CheY-like chemotaxis protein
MSAQEMSDLFEPLDRPGANRAAIEGAGVGLTVCRHLMQLMGGALGVESESGKGSVFWLDCLPAGGAQPASDATQSSAQAVGDERRRTLLYIEDNPANLRLIECVVKRYSHLRLLSATTAEEGIRIARQARPDLIIVDVNLPGMNGYEVLGALNEHPATGHIPVIALTAAARPADIEKGLASGFRRYLTKPVDVHAFMQVVQAELSHPH